MSISLQVSNILDLSTSLDSISREIHTLRILTHSQFWHTGESLVNLVDKLGRFKSLQHLEICGGSYATILSIARFTMILNELPNIKNLKMNIRIPFPGEYRIQDRSFIINRILQTLFKCPSLESTVFVSKEQNTWVRELNGKIRSLFRNRQGLKKDRISTL